MTTVPPALPASAPLAQQARERFVTEVEAGLPELVEAIRLRMIELVDGASSTREMQERRDAMLEFDQLRAQWQAAAQKAWRSAINPPTATARIRLESVNFELIGDEVVERRILSSRLALAIAEKATWELNDLRVRMQHLEKSEELAPGDVLKPESVAQLMVEQWAACALPRQSWVLVQELIQKHMVDRSLAAYRATNAFLVEQGVVPDIDLSTKVKRGAAARGRSTRPNPVAGPESGPASDAGAVSDYGGGFGGPGGGGGFAGGGRDGGAAHAPGGSGYGYQGGNFSSGSAPGGGYGSDGGYGGSDDGNGYSGGYGAGGASRPGEAGRSDDGQAGGGYGAGGGAGVAGFAGAGRFGGGGGGPGGSGGNGGPGYSQGAGSEYGGAGGEGGGGFNGRASRHGGRGGPGRAGAGAAGGGGAGAGGSAAEGGAAGRSFGGEDGSGSFPGAGERFDVAPGHSTPGAAFGAGGPAGSGARGVADETRLMTSSTPLARARMRANGVIGQLKRLLTERVGFDSNHAGKPSPALTEAFTNHATHVQTEVHTQANESSGSPHERVVYDDAAVEQVALDLRQRTGDLKKKAATSSEKATIEIVALMFQAILSEERIPAAVRVWFARLQMPVLRVALSEPEFFGSLQHPARLLIDRMGSCVMGFNAVAISGSALEIEIKRVVQVIEQYPETGRRVFQLVYGEFEKFLSHFLTEKGDTQRLVSVAQQVEQKETMAIQYTIELRKMLNDIPVREEIREFLFKVWAEVLAVAAVKHGPQHQETIALKQSAADLVWAASAKPNRNDRARVIQDLPKLLLRLRQGMTLMGVQGNAQESHIKIIGDTLADAFLSKTEAIPHAQIEAMAKRLANLEDFVADDPATDLPLDAESIEMMLGIDASMIVVVADGGSKPSDAMLAWALELQLGNWFTLDHNGQASQVQYAWRSDRRQLHLFASPEGRSFLIQARRLAAYLQAGLLLPQEEEALTVRATRDALAKLDANPERLLA